MKARKTRKINTSEYCCTSQFDALSKLYQAEDELIRLRIENQKLYTKLITSNLPLLKELQSRVRNVIHILNSNDMPLSSRHDVSRTQLFSILSLLSQLTNYEQKNC